MAMILLTPYAMCCTYALFALVRAIILRRPDDLFCTEPEYGPTRVEVLSLGNNYITAKGAQTLAT
eukprot:1205269-Rhodomonas_salina.2